MVENNLSRHFKGIPICTFDPYYSKLGYLANHPREYENPKYENPGAEKLGCYGEHIHRELEVHYVVSGEYIAGINGKERIVRAGDMLIINPFDTHSGYYVVSDEPLYYYCTIFDLEFFSQSLPSSAKKLVHDINTGSARFRECVSRSEPGIPALEDIFRALHDDFTDGRSLSLAADVYRLMSILLDHCISDEALSDRSRDFEFISRVIEIIGADFASPLTTTDMSARFGYSESHFCRRFRECFGMTFSDYLNRFRLRRAADCSLSADRSLTDIAAMVGFNDYAYFSRSFSKYYGMPPMKYFSSRK
ncbi:MAG: AraC family transcriptional regulator [Candidatus Flemingiibacterium sp.]